MTRPLATLLGLLLCVAVPQATADVLHLESGGSVRTATWYVEGDWIYYESEGGMIGIPRSLVARVEQQPSTDPARATPPTRPRSRRSASDASGPLRERLEQLLGSFRAGDYDAASYGFFDILQDEPELHAVRAYYVSSELALGHLGSAQASLYEGLARAPEQAIFHELMGDLRNREERVEEALRSWSRAQELEPRDRVTEKIEKARRELQAGGRYDFARTPHFNVRYDGLVDSHLAGSVMDYLEERILDLGAKWEHIPEQPVTVLLYPDREFREVSQAPDWAGGLFDGKIRVPLGGLSSLDDAARRVLSHELMHAIIHSKSHGRAPRWLHEGLAQRAEGRVLRDEERAWVRQRLAGKDGPSWDDDGFSYTVALSLTDYLVARRGERNVAYVLQLLGEGRTLDEALYRIFGESYDALCRRWADGL